MNPTKDDIEILIELSQDDDEDVRRRVAGNLNTPAEVLGILAFDCWYVQREVAANPNTPEWALQKLSTHPYDEEIVYAVAGNLNTPAEVLEELFNKNDDAIIFSLIHNPSTPIEILIKIASLYSKRDHNVKEKIQETEILQVKLRKYAKDCGIEDAYDLPVDWLIEILKGDK